MATGNDEFMSQTSQEGATACNAAGGDLVSDQGFRHLFDHATKGVLRFYPSAAGVKLKYSFYTDTTYGGL